MPAGHHRDGQDRGPRTELRLRRRRDLRRRAAAATTTDAGPRRGAGRRDRLARQTMRICRAVAWEVDAALRPEGKDGPLVRTLASHEAYYKRWASTWEFQALLKARPVAGDLELGARYLDTIAPLVWTAAERPDFVADVQAMRRRVRRPHRRRRSPTASSSSGPGGLRDVEFAVQLLQLVHGRGDETLRDPGDPAGAGRAARRRLRRPRRRGQPGRRVPVPARDRAPACSCAGCAAPTSCPDEPASCSGWPGRWATGRTPRRCARRSGRPNGRCTRARSAGCTRSCSTGRCWRRWPGCPTEALRLTPVEARRRLAALGFADPAGALRHIEALTAGLSRRAVAAADPAAGACCPTSPTPRTRTPACSPTGRCPTSSAARPGTCGCCATRGRSRHRLAYLLGTSRYVAEHARTGTRGAAAARRRRRACTARATRSCARRWSTPPTGRTATRPMPYRWSAACAARSCCGSRSPTCSGG